MQALQATTAWTVFAGMGRSGRNAQLLVLHVGHDQASVPYCLQVTLLMALLCVGWPGMDAPARYFLYQRHLLL